VVLSRDGVINARKSFPLNPFDDVDIEILEAIEDISAQSGVNELLMKCLIMNESAFEPLAMRYEVNYRWVQSDAKVRRHAKRCNISQDTEDQCQRFSYGLCQIMGATLRDMGFKDPLVYAFDIETNIEWGCKMIGNAMRRYDNDIDHVLASYNGGHGAVIHKKRHGIYSEDVRDYISDVKSHMKHLT